MERRPRKVKNVKDINKNLSKSNQERKEKLKGAFPIPEWRLNKDLIPEWRKEKG